MPFYEIVYETGRVSVAYYEDEDEAKSAISAHHQRALDGQPGGPIGAPAERIAAVYAYDKHPNEYNAEQTMSGDVATKEVTSLVKALADDNGVVAIDRLAMEVRNLTHPMNPTAKGFESQFKMKESSKLTLGFLPEKRSV